MVMRKGKMRRIHTAKFSRCVEEVRKSKYNGSKYNPYAVCFSAIGRKGSLLKKRGK